MAPQMTDFITAVRNIASRLRSTNATDSRSATIVNMGGCALRLNRTLHFDPVKTWIQDDDAANRLINQPMRTLEHLNIIHKLTKRSESW